MEKLAKDKWNQKIGINSVFSKISMLSVPICPDNFGKEYQFPDTAETTSQDLGNWMMKLASWKSFALRLLSKVDIERTILDESHDIMVSKRYFKLLKDGEKVTKDSAIGSLISEDEKFKELKIKLIETEAESEALKKIIDIYTTQLDAISREISRRASEMRSIGQGL